MAAIEEIRETPLEDVIPSSLGLKRGMCKCPFHDDKSPSMSIRKGKPFYKCFSCGASGDTIRFFENYYDVDFLTAVKMIAEASGVKFDEEKREKTSKEKDIDQVIDWVISQFDDKKTSACLGNARDLEIEALPRHLASPAANLGLHKLEGKVFPVRNYSGDIAGIDCVSNKRRSFIIPEGLIGTLDRRNTKGRLVICPNPLVAEYLGKRVDGDMVFRAPAGTTIPSPKTFSRIFRGEKQDALVIIPENDRSRAMKIMRSALPHYGDGGSYLEFVFYRNIKDISDSDLLNSSPGSEILLAWMHENTNPGDRLDWYNKAKKLSDSCRNKEFKRQLLKTLFSYITN